MRLSYTNDRIVRIDVYIEVCIDIHSQMRIVRVLYLHYYICLCFSTQESRIPISFGSAQPGSPAACSVGNGLLQNCTVTPPPRLHSLGKVSLPVCEDRTPTPLEKEDLQTSDIRSQIAKIEQLLSSEGHRPQKRCRVDEF